MQLSPIYHHKDIHQKALIGYLRSLFVLNIMLALSLVILVNSIGLRAT